MQRGVECGLSTPRRAPPLPRFNGERVRDEGRTSRTASPQRGARSVRCCVLSPLLRHTTMVRSRPSISWTGEIGPHQCRWSDTFRRLLTKLLRIGGIFPIWWERAVAGPESSQEGWGGTAPICPEISSRQRERKESLHHSASQWAGDNILSWRPDRGKKVFAHPNSDGLGDRFSKTSSKTHLDTKCVILDEMQHFRGPRAPNLAPFSLSVRESLSRASANEGEKNSHRSPALPRHSTSLHRGFQSWAGSTPPAGFGNRANWSPIRS